MTTDLPMVARDLELAAVTDVLESAERGRGEAVLITGEAGIGKTRLLGEARTDAERRGLLVLRGRAVESGGAYRPLVEAFARPASSFADHPDLVGVRPTLARVLPGWLADAAVLAPMADPAAVLAEALILLLQVMAPNGAALILDDLHWADPDTVSVLMSLEDSVDTLPLALVLAARAETTLPTPILRLGTGRSARVVPLHRLTSVEVGDAVRQLRLPHLTDGQLDQLVADVDGLPLVLDEFVRQLRESGTRGGRLEFGRSTLASAVQGRLIDLPADTRLVLDAVSVIGDSDADVLIAATGLDLDRLGRALHDGLASTLLVSAPTPMGVAWRHVLIGDLIRDRLLPLEQQAIARRAADRLARGGAPSEGQLRQAARLYELAGYPHSAAQQLVGAARLAVANAALDAAQQYLADAQALAGYLPDTARDVLVERIDTLVLAGRAADAYDSGMAAVAELGSSSAQTLVFATARAAYVTGLFQEGRELLARLELESDPLDCRISLLRAHAAYAARRPEAAGLGEQAAARAQQEGHGDLACEALVVAGLAARRTDTARALRAFHQASALSQRHDLRIWEVRAQAELGVIDMETSADTARLDQARRLATNAGMVGTVAEIDLRLCEATLASRGFMAAYPLALRATSQARQLHLTDLHTRAYTHLAVCALPTDRPLEGTTPTDGELGIQGVVADEILATDAGLVAVRAALGLRAWIRGDSATAIRTISAGLQPYRDEIKRMPWWGFLGLLRVVDGAQPDAAFGGAHLFGHHGNSAARALATMICRLRAGQPAEAALAEEEQYLRDTPFLRHLLRTVVARAAFQAGFVAAEGWLREADAYFAAAGERTLQRRVRHDLAEIGAKVPRRAAATVSPRLARLGITPREVEILALVNAGFSNVEIAERLVISVRTVETHVSSMLQKTGTRSREQLPSALEPAG